MPNNLTIPRETRIQYGEQNQLSQSIIRCSPSSHPDACRTRDFLSHRGPENSHRVNDDELVSTANGERERERERETEMRLKCGNKVLIGY